MKSAHLAVAIAAVLAAAHGCGTPSSSPSTREAELGTEHARIVGGIADLNHRYVVSLNGCTGTVISKYTVLTAGHCFNSVSSAGFGPRTSGATTIRVASKVLDPLYKDICDQDATYDLAVVKLAEPAPVQPVPLLRTKLENTSKYIGPSWVWVGYGLTGQGGTTGTKRVTTFPVDLIGPATGRGSLCEIPDTLIYFTAKGRNTCNGDSGGPSFFVHGGVEYLAGVVSSGDNSCVLDGTQQRSDQPHIDRFIQMQIDLNEGTDPCRSNGVCDETCNTNGQVGDPDCAAAHCSADGICSEACVAPRDPDCATVDGDNCGDNGVCDLKCTTDPDCTRDCAAEGNCIPNCPVPDPDCTGQDGGTIDAGSTDAGGGAPDAGSRDGGDDGSTSDVATPMPEAGGDTGSREGGASDGATVDAVTRDTAARDAAPIDATPTDAGAAGAAPRDAAMPDDVGSTSDGAAGAGAGGAGNGTVTGMSGTASESGCSCRSVAPRARIGGGSWLALGIAAIAARRRGRRR